MGLLTRLWGLACVLALLGGCMEINQIVSGIIKPQHNAAPQTRPPGQMTQDQLEQERLRSRSEYVDAAAVAAPGTVVCRKLPVGLAEIDWLRGVVLGERSGQVSVKIVDPGKFLQVLNGETIVQGAVVHGPVTDWTPCIK